MSLRLYSEISRAFGAPELDPPPMLARVVEGLPSWFDVSGLAEASIAAAGVQTAVLAGIDPQRIRVDRRLCGLWFGWTIRPQGWPMPDAWDPIAGDYKTKDGWIRLHTNAPPLSSAKRPVQAAETVDDLAPEIELTDWGPARRIKFPVSMSGVTIGPVSPAGKLRSSPPRW
jgi:hypothetical protein